MARDKTTGVARQPSKILRRPGEREETLTGRPQPTALPQEKPVPALQKHGIQIGISEVNRRVEEVTRAHERAFGTKPSPGLIFDVLRSPNVPGAVNYDDLFKLPRSRREAGAFKALRSSPPEEVKSDLEVVKEAIELNARGVRLPDLPREQRDRLNEAFARNPKLRERWVEESIKGRIRAREIEAATAVPDFLTPVGKTFTKATAQIGEALVTMPYGLYVISKDVGLDVKDALVQAAPGTENTPLFARTRKLGADMARQVAEDFRHPLRNPGYLAMDIWAIVTLGAGGAARVSNARRAAREAEKGKGRTFARTLLTKPVAGSVDIGFGMHTAAVPLFENAAVRALQRPLLERRNRALLQRQIEGFEGRHTWVYDEIFSTERKLTRERRVNTEIEYAVAVAPLVEFTRMARWDSRAKAVISQVFRDPKNIRDFNRLRAREKIGLEKAVQVLFTDDPNPVLAWRSLHERQISAAQREIHAVGRDKLVKPGTKRRKIKELRAQITNHRVQLEALSIAEDVIANPSKRVQPFLEKALEVSEGQARVKRAVLGLTDEVADQAIAKVGAIVRGEHLIDLGDGKMGITIVDPKPVLQKVEARKKRLANAKKKLAEAEATLRIQPNNADAIVAAGKARDKVAKRNHELAIAQQGLETLKGAAEPLSRKSEDSAYLPYRRELHRDPKLGSVPIPRNTPRRFGSAPPDAPPSLRYRLTGSAIEIGDFRWDTSALLAEEYVTTLKAAFAITQYRDLWSIGKSEITSDYAHPIRNVKNAPARLKEVITAMEGRTISKDAAELLSDPAFKELREWVYPDRDKLNEMLKSGEVKKSEIRWVDERFIFDKVAGQDVFFWRNVDNYLGGVFTPVNEPMRLALIFLTPAYLLNAGGNAALAFIHQGPLAIPNIARAYHAKGLYGDEAVSILDALGGETLTGSLVTEHNLLTRGSQSIMKGWQKITDQAFRRSAVIHELRRRKVITDDMTPDQVLAALRDPANKKLLTESGRAARQAMLDFNRMSWPERATLRHIFFIYSFMRASTIYGARFLVEHPIKADLLSGAGEGRIEEIKKALDGLEVPEWFTRHGYFPIGEGFFADPVQFNVPAMLVDMGYMGASLFSDVPYASPSEILSPAWKTINRLATGRDEEGRELEGSDRIPFGQTRVGKTIISLFRETPVGYAAARGEREEKEAPLPAPPIRSGSLDPVASAMRRESAALQHGTFENEGFWNTWGRVIGRSAIPYEVEAEAANARFWRDMRDSNPERYVQHQIDRVNEMLQRQAKVMGVVAPPAEVQSAVELVARVSLKIEEWRKEYKEGVRPVQEPSKKEIALATVDALLELDRIDEDEAKRLKKWVSTARTPQEANEARLTLLWENGGKAWKDWNDRVNDVVWFDSVEFEVALEDGRDDAIGDFVSAAKASRPKKWEYGRGYYEFAEQYDQQRERIRSLDGTAARAAEAEFRLWLQENDRPVTIRGTTFPSYQRMQYMKRGKESRESYKRQIAVGSWETASAFEREVVGRPASQEVMQGWHALRTQLDQEDQERAPGESAPRGREEQLAREWIGRAIPAFLRDYDFAKRPLAGRLRDLKPITASPNAADWHTLLDSAARWHAQWRDAGYTQAEISETWKREQAPKVREWIATRSAGFQAEVNVYQESYANFIESLVS